MISKIEDIIFLDEVIGLEKEETPAAQKQQILLYKLRYLSEGNEVAGYVGAPADYLEKRYPVLIFNRGGNREFAALRSETIVRYAKLGFVVLGSQYRGNCGGTGREEFGGRDIYDVAKLMEIGEKLAFAAQGGVYMAGHSRGGMMTYLMCAMYPEHIRAAAVKAGVADCFNMYEMREQGMKDVFTELVGGTPQELPAEYARRSATCFAKRIRVPMLILHGTRDWRVSLSSAVRVHELLDKYGTENKLIIYQGADHSLNGYPADEDMLEWFARFA